jgi:hypothetical protein
MITLLLSLPWWQLAILTFASLPVALALLFPFAIQYKRPGLREPWLFLAYVVAGIATVIDIIANYTTLALLLWDWPQAGEFTFSKRLVRLKGRADWKGDIARDIAVILNRIDPLHDHVL